MSERRNRSSVTLLGRWIRKETESNSGSHRKFNLLRRRLEGVKEWAVRVSNPRPTGCKPAALPLS